MTMPPYRPGPGPTPTTLPPQPVRPSAAGGSAQPAKVNTAGVVSILLAMVNLVVMLAAAGFSGQAYVAMVKLGGKDFDANDPSIEPLMGRVMICVVIALVCWVVSLIPFILGILGARQPPRSMGITAIVLAVLTPLLGFAIWCMFVLPVA